jgi:hypothetical protein
MAEEEKKENVPAEVKPEEKKEEAEKEEPKKENGFSRWWKDTKKKVNDSVLEDHIKSAYEDTHHAFGVYAYGEGFFNEEDVYGEIIDGSLVYFGSEAVKPDSVIIDTKDNTAYYAKESTPIEVQSTYETVVYTRQGTKLALDKNVQEVKVIKAGQRYFIYKGSDAKK